MSRTLSLSCFAAVFLALCHASAAADKPSLDLTTEPVIWQGNEGGPVQALRVTDGQTKYEFRVPDGWLPEGGGKVLHVNSTDGTRAWMKLLVIPNNAQAPDQQPDPSSPEAQVASDQLKELAKQYIPGGGGKTAVFIKEVESPFLLMGHYSDEFTFTYQSGATRDVIAVAFADFSDTERMVVVYSASGADFQKVRQAVIRSMFTWRKARKVTSPTPSAAPAATR
jgi:hypothetical protein